MTQILPTMRKLASPMGETPLIRAIFGAQTKILMAKFEIVRRRIAADLPLLSAATGFEAAAADLRRQKPEIQREIIGHPAFSSWTNAAHTFVDRNGHAPLSEMHLRAHLEQFGAFSVAAAILAKNDALLTNVRTDSLGAINLSGVGRTEDLGEGPFRMLPICVVRGTLYYDKRTFAIRPIRAPFDAAPIEPLIDLAISANYTGAPADADGRVEQWSEHAKRLADFFPTIWPQIWAEMRVSPMAMRPIRAPGPETHASATLRELPGLMLLSPTPNFAVFAEAVVHEFHHQKLNAIMSAEVLTSGEVHDCYSPWRSDARPVSGLLHGAYAFHGVTLFWERMFSPGPSDLTGLRQHLHAREVLEQVKHALQQLEVRSDLTDAGCALVHALRESLCRLDQCLPDITKADRTAIITKLETHRTRWHHSQNRRLVTVS